MAMSTRERTLLIIVGVLAVGALAWFLIFGGGGDAEEDAAPTPVTPPSPPPTAEPPELPVPRPPRTFAFFGGRDPFEPLVVAEAGAGGTGTAAAPTEPGEDGAPSDGETPSDGFQPTNGDDGDGGGGAPVSIGGREVVLIDIFTRGGESVAQVSVDGQTYVAGEEDRFAGNFEVTSIERTCATFLFGDESFTLCEGERPK
jgi:hypothetical protein